LPLPCISGWLVLCKKGGKKTKKGFMKGQRKKAKKEKSHRIREMRNSR